MLFIVDRIIQILNSVRIESSDDHHVLSGNGVVLKVLTHTDVKAFFGLHREATGDEHFQNHPIQPEDTPESFTQRIVSACEMVWTIRLGSCPDTIIGDCALRYGNKRDDSLVVEGSITPSYRGQGIMAAAFSLVARFVKNNYDTTALTFTSTTITVVSQTQQTISLKKRV
ncbi:GNAT family N-acetyltransferase [Parapedobacter koreensis]|uniref:Acetyltransferase (GNAT) domain-containing protein n=1 Tax=Parapedobacter koreensis TaxID=332977 RepID=A0A1H7FXL2_9SPHI|nr:GNAT family N-acetyltransferase [Parapedobacter koreensis]SEK30651.1 Acetyltransferase (GNAT) domain-containing protein [Parapedobacter koreensis]